MSRAMNLTLAEALVTEMCHEAGVSISAIEPLPKGGTHLVCTTSEGADAMRLKFEGNVIGGRVVRYPFFRPKPA